MTAIARCEELSRRMGVRCCGLPEPGWIVSTDSNRSVQRPIYRVLRQKGLRLQGSNR